MIDSSVGVTKYIYAYKNKVAGVFYTPFILDDDPDLTFKKLIRTVQIDNKAAENLKHLELYQLGWFLDNNGDLQANKQFLLDIDEVIAQFLHVDKGDLEDVK